MLLVAITFVAAFSLIFMTLYMLWVAPEQERIKRLKRSLERLTRQEVERVSVFRDELLSSVPILQRLLSRINLAYMLQKWILQAGMNVRPGLIIMLSLVMALATYDIISTLRSANLLVTLLVSLISGCLPYIYIWQKRNARFRRLEEQLPDALDYITRAMRAGHSFTSAVEMVGAEMADPISTEFKRLFDHMNFGMPIREAMLELTDRAPLVDIKFLATAVLLQRETGGSLVEVLDKLAYIIRERIRLRGDIRTRSASGKLSAYTLSSLPIIMALVIYYFQPDYILVLFKDEIGHYLLAAWAICLVIGFTIIHRMVNIRV